MKALLKSTYTMSAILPYSIFVITSAVNFMSWDAISHICDWVPVQVVKGYMQESLEIVCQLRDTNVTKGFTIDKLYMGLIGLISMECLVEVSAQWIWVIDPRLERWGHLRWEGDEIASEHIKCGATWDGDKDSLGKWLGIRLEDCGGKWIGK